MFEKLAQDLVVFHYSCFSQSLLQRKLFRINNIFTMSLSEAWNWMASLTANSEKHIRFLIKKTLCNSLLFILSPSKGHILYLVYMSKLWVTVKNLTFVLIRLEIKKCVCMCETMIKKKNGWMRKVMNEWKKNKWMSLSKCSAFPVKILMKCQHF